MIDVGANLTHESFAADLDAVLDRACAAGVSKIVVTGASRQGSIDALELARRHPDYLVATAGNHPHHASEYDADMDALLRELAAQAEVKACGEAGLDYFRDFSPRPDQQSCFEAQLQIAVETGKPVFLHQRDAHEDFLAMVRPFRDQLDRMVVHCFTDTRKALFDYLDLDLHVGITGWICDERRGHHLRELVGNIPAGRLMIETDSPYLLPRDLKPRPKSRRNEPFHLPHIADVIAHCRGESPEQLAAHTTATAEEFFSLS